MHNTDLNFVIAVGQAALILGFSRSYVSRIDTKANFNCI